MKTEKRRTGDLGETIACKFLQNKGFVIVDRNYSKPWGEIDIIAVRGKVVHFIEVKAISREMGYRPEEQLTPLKLKKVARTAALYMESVRDVREFQIDAVSVIMDRAKRRARCAYYPQIL